MTYRQCDLRELGGSTRLTCWLRADPKLKPHVTVTLKETGSKRWFVAWVSESTREHSELNKRWHVGGL